MLYQSELDNLLHISSQSYWHELRRFPIICWKRSHRNSLHIFSVFFFACADTESRFSERRSTTMQNKINIRSLIRKKKKRREKKGRRKMIVAVKWQMKIKRLSGVVYKFNGISSSRRSIFHSHRPSWLNKKMFSSSVFPFFFLATYFLGIFCRCCCTYVFKKNWNDKREKNEHIALSWATKQRSRYNYLSYGLCLNASATVSVVSFALPPLHSGYEQKLTKVRR